MNLYAYVKNNPVNWVDPWGLEAATATLTGTAVIEGGGAVAVSPVIGTFVIVGSIVLGMPSEIGEEPDIEQIQADWLRQNDYERYKNVCNTPPPPTGDKCQDMRNEIERWQKCAELRDAWDRRWAGNHAIEISKAEKNARKWQKRLDNAWDCKDKPPVCKE
jgi:uncharacterized protein RhaS with RHS repeats